MKNRQVKDMAASVHQRLLNKSRQTGRPFSELLQYYAMERFLYRLSKSAFADKFVLKGALMLTVWKAPVSRPTRDMDFLSERAYPVMREAARFYSQFLVEDPATGWLISTPSNSPENGGLVAGPTIGGSRRWLVIGPMRLQPSELAKVAFILVNANLLARSTEEGRPLVATALSFGVMIVPMMLVLREPDLGTSLVFLAVWVGMVFWYGIPGILLLGGPGGAGQKKAATTQYEANALFVKKCLGCNVSVADPEKPGRTRDDWHLVVNVMHGYGLDLSAAESEMIIDLLYELRQGIEKEAG